MKGCHPAGNPSFRFSCSRVSAGGRHSVLGFLQGGYPIGSGHVCQFVCWDDIHGCNVFLNTFQPTRDPPEILVLASVAIPPAPVETCWEQFTREHCDGCGPVRLSSRCARPSSVCQARAAAAEANVAAAAAARAREEAAAAATARQEVRPHAILHIKHYTIRNYKHGVLGSVSR